MKKFIIAIALLSFFQVVNAQAQSIESAKNDLERAIAKTQNPRKAKKAKFWYRLGKAYVEAYDAPYGNIWSGVSRQEVNLIMRSEKPSSTEQVKIQGQDLVKETYPNKILYFSPQGKLVAIQITNFVDSLALQKATQAFDKAYSMDSDYSKDVAEGLDNVAKKYVSEAYNKYQLGKLMDASKCFEAAADIYENPPISKVDTNSLYNAGFTAWSVGDKARAKKFFERCYKHGYFAANGEVFSKLADVDSVNAKKYLEEGFTKFPESQSILIGLIKYYMNKKESTDKLFELLDKAKKNEPNNASLYYVEGNIRAKLGQIDKAVKAYEECAKIDPNYEYGYIGEGSMYFNQALEIQKKAQAEMDDAKYQKLNEEFEKTLKSCLEPFEKAYNTTKQNNIKVSIAEYLKNAYFRFRQQDPKYKAAYEKYNNIVNTGKAE